MRASSVVVVKLVDVDWASGAVVNVVVGVRVVVCVVTIV